MSTENPCFPLPVPEKPLGVRGSTAPIAREASDLVRVYVWQAPVRLTHWAIAASIVTLAATGIYIGRPFLIVPGEAGRHFAMGTARFIHFVAAIVFTLAVLSRVIWMFLGNRYAQWKIFIPVERKRLLGIIGTLKFYLFLQRKPPGFVSHNPLAGLAYTAVFGLYFVMIGTGLALYSVSAPLGSWLRVFDVLIPVFGGLQTARWIHHIVMWLLLGFAVHHVASSLLMSLAEQKGTIESIFSGYKFVPREDLVHSGYRYVIPPEEES